MPRDISDLVLPLGATMHMDGSCFSCVLKIAFLFGVFGIPFEGAGLIVKILLVAVFSSVAMSGIPGGGYIDQRRRRLRGHVPRRALHRGKGLARACAEGKGRTLNFPCTFRAGML